METTVSAHAQLSTSPAAARKPGQKYNQQKYKQGYKD